MILGGLAAETGFSPSDIGAMTDEEALFWWRAIGDYRKAVNAEVDKRRRGQ